MKILGIRPCEGRWPETANECHSCDSRERKLSFSLRIASQLWRHTEKYPSTVGSSTVENSLARIFQFSLGARCDKTWKTRLCTWLSRASIVWFLFGETSREKVKRHKKCFYLFLSSRSEEEKIGNKRSFCLVIFILEDKHHFIPFTSFSFRHVRLVCCANSRWSIKSVVLKQKPADNVLCFALRK